MYHLPMIIFTFFTSLFLHNRLDYQYQIWHWTSTFYFKKTRCYITKCMRMWPIFVDHIASIVSTDNEDLLLWTLMYKNLCFAISWKTCFHYFYFSPSLLFSNIVFKWQIFVYWKTAQTKIVLATIIDYFLILWTGWENLKFKTMNLPLDLPGRFVILIPCGKFPPSVVSVFSLALDPCDRDLADLTWDPKDGNLERLARLLLLLKTNITKVNLIFLVVVNLKLSNKSVGIILSKFAQLAGMHLGFKFVDPGAFCIEDWMSILKDHTQ